MRWRRGRVPVWSAAASRRCLPHGLARACCYREPRKAAGANPGEEGREQAPHSTRALRSREREARGRRNTRRSRGAGSVAPASCRRISAAPPKSQIANNMPFGSGQARVSSEAPAKSKTPAGMPGATYFGAAVLRTSVRRCYGVVTQVKQALRGDSAGLASGPCDTGGGGPCAVTAMRCKPEEKTFSEVVPLMPWMRPCAFAGSGTVPSTNASSMLDEVSYTTNCSTQFVATFAEQAGVREKS